MESHQKPRSKALGFRLAFPDEYIRLVQIERRCFPHPWQHDEFNSDFLLTVIFLAGDPDAVVGYIATRCVGNSIVIENLAIDTPFQRQGFGRQVLGFAAGFAPAVNPLGIRRAIRPQRLEAWVWERNIAAQMLFKSCGFVASKVVRNFYEEGTEAANDSAILFAKPLGGVEFSKFPLVARIAQ